MENNFKVGESVFFIHNGETRYLRISRIDNDSAIFSLGCSCRRIAKPLNKLYKTLEDLRKERNINEQK